jgi:hypothetical protein
MARHALIDDGVLHMALVGYEQEKTKIEAAMADIQARLGRPGAALVVMDHATPRKGTMSAAARRRIAAAQRKRWAGKREAGAAAVRPKRKLSAAGRRAIAEATRKRWAALRKLLAQSPKGSRRCPPRFRNRLRRRRQEEWWRKKRRQRPRRHG